MSLRSRIRRAIEQQQFNPNLLGLLVNPFYFARKGLRKNVAELAPLISGKILDVGCGTQPYRNLFATDDYIGLEIDSPGNRLNERAAVLYDGKSIPFEDSTFDAVVLFEVFEHVFNPDELLAEIHRVLKLGGKIFLTVPFVWAEHEQPYDYARYSSFGLQHVLRKHGFEIERHSKSVDDFSVLFQLVNYYLFTKMSSATFRWNVLSTFLFMAPINVVGAVVSRLLPSFPELYLDNIVLAKKADTASKLNDSTSPPPST